MKKLFAILCLSTALAALGAQTAKIKALYVYDEVDEHSTPYLGHFRDAFAAEGIAHDEVIAAEAASKDLSQYDAVVVHGMVMAFAMKSPVRDWLKTGPNLAGKKVALLVTANRWFLGTLFGQLSKLAAKTGAATVDAVSMATQKTDAAEETAAVRRQVARLK